MSRSTPTAASESRFSHRLDALQQLAQDVLLHAGKQGASACEVDISEGFGQSVTVRKRGSRHHRIQPRQGDIGVTVYLGQRARPREHLGLLCGVR
jgi:PmbA protein